MNTYTFSNEELEDHADTVKYAVVSALVKEGLLDKEAADEWSLTHTVIYRDRPMFRDLLRSWISSKPALNTFYYIVVKSVDPHDPKEE